MATDPSAEPVRADDLTTIGRPVLSQRYHALDRVRAAAMLLGVVYHAILFRMFVGGFSLRSMGTPDGSRLSSEWLHSFRMPLFFLISGFFGRMMLEKYGARNYLRRRWQRIAIPLAIGMFTFSPLYIVTRDLMAGAPRPGFGPMGPPPGGGPPGGGSPPGDFANMPPPPPGFVPPPLQRFDEDGNGTLNDAEWKVARKEFRPPPGGGPGGPMPGPFGPPGGGLSERLFGRYARYFDLHHLWFLWYLLVFVTIAPWVTKAMGWVLLRPTPEAADRMSLQLIRSGVAPLLFGLIATPALMLTSSPFGWSLGLAPAIFRGFPDFLLHYDPDMLFYGIFFLWGWWLHRHREELPGLGPAWLPNLIIGLLAFSASTALADAYSRRTGIPHYALVRLAGYALYCSCTAFTATAFIGVFLRYFDRPSAGWRYLADTALWVYLIHQPLVIIGLAMVGPLHLAWWIQTAIVSAGSAAAALVLYEMIVRPTPLVRLFGPAFPRKLPVAAPSREVGPPIGT
ncbi:MAG: acyltransferase family protein [Isosphaeraceae bacterium]